MRTPAARWPRGGGAEQRHDHQAGDEGELVAALVDEHTVLGVDDDERPEQVEDVQGGEDVGQETEDERDPTDGLDGRREPTGVLAAMSTTSRGRRGGARALSTAGGAF